MNQRILNIIFFLAITPLVAWCEGKPGEIEKSFVNPPASARPWCYWYWMNGNVTREGIIADLQGMHDVGVGGVLLFDIGIHPAGTVTNRSREWYDLVKLSVAEAQKHDIKVSFHCPGWSASGGPWITPDKGMQELTWSETEVKGGSEISVRLPQPLTKLKCYSDIAVLAIPAADDDKILPIPEFRDTDGKPLSKGAAAMDCDATTIASLPREFDLVYPEPVQIRSMFVRGANGIETVQAVLSVWDEALGSFRVLGTNRNYTSGPFSSQLSYATVEPVKASKFRVLFPTKRASHVNLEQLVLTGGFRVSDWPCKAGFATDHIETGPRDVQPKPEQVIPPDRIVDLTGKLAADGELKWSAPAGRWIILRMGYTPTGVNIAPAPMGGDGLECDKMSRDVTDFHYDQCVTPVLRDLGSDLTKKAVAYYHVDSYEAGWQNWTAKLPKDFKARRGYDIKKYLPALTGRVVGDIETTEKFLWDFRRTIGDLFADAHYGRLAERCHADGLQFSTEPYGGPFEMLQVGLRADHPMMEFWLPTNPNSRKFAAEAVSVGHSGERAIIGAESFTSGAPDPTRDERWNNHPFSLKTLGDYVYCCGVNRFVIHVSAHQPLVGEKFKPGFTCGCNGIHFDRGNTWWEHGAKEWVDYLARCQALLQAGEPVADALYFLGNDSPYGCGPFDPALPEGYDYDACNSEVLEKLKVKDGKITLPLGKQYRYLVLPRHGRVTLASLRKLVDLAKDGARLIGPAPKGSPSLTDAASSAKYGKLTAELSGRLTSASSFASVLAADRLAPDFTFDDEPGLILHATHRRIGDADVYFVASAGQTSGEVDCSFRVSGKIPELWRPDTGRMEPCAVYEQTGETIRIPLRFDPAGSVFVVFRPGTSAVHAVGLALDNVAAGPKPVLTVRNARYGIIDDPQHSLDVTDKLAAKIQDGKIKFRGFNSLAGDPAPGVVKQLKVEYAMDGKTAEVVAKDGDWLRLPPPTGAGLPCELRSDGKQLELRSCDAGKYTVAFSGGRTQAVEIASVPAPLHIEGPWTVKFPSGWGAPEKIELPNLISWPEHTDIGVRYFSGTAVYRKVFDIPPGFRIQDSGVRSESKNVELETRNSKLLLDLGRVEVIAEVWVNGKSLGTLWKPPFSVDVTDVIKQGANELEVRITNLWPNRLIGDEAYPDDMAVGYSWTGGGIHSWPQWLKKGVTRPEPRRQTFFTWKHWNKDETLLPSGLLGPVTLKTEAGVVVKQ